MKEFIRSPVIYCAKIQERMTERIEVAMDQSSPQEHKIPMSLDNAYQIILRSFILFFLLIAIFSASTFQSLNWMTFICVILSGALFAFKKGTYVLVNENEVTCYYFKGLKQTHIPLKDIHTVSVNEKTRLVELISMKDKVLYSFHLSQKHQKRLMSSLQELSDHKITFSYKKI